VNSGCAGYVTALDVAWKYLRADERYRRVLVVGAYAMSKFLDRADKKTVTIFADGAGATLVELAEEPGVLAITVAGALPGMRGAPGPAASRVIAADGAKEVSRVEPSGIRLRLWIERGHHLAAHRVGEERADEHRRGGVHLTLGDERVIATEPFCVAAQLMEGALGAFGHTWRHFRVLFDLPHRLADHRARSAEVRELSVAPVGQLALGLHWLLGEPDGIDGAGRMLAQRLGDEGGLGAEEAEERDLVDAGLIGDPTRGRAAEAGLAVKARGGGEEFLSTGHKDRAI
jgi:hypothetical protein